MMSRQSGDGESRPSFIHRLLLYSRLRWPAIDLILLLPLLRILVSHLLRTLVNILVNILGWVLGFSLGRIPARW